LKLKPAIDNILFALSIFIAFLLAFEDALVIPPWLHVIGRMHPLILHFPIVILLAAIAGLLFLPGRYEQEVRTTLMIGALTAHVTIIMGIFLAKEGDATGTTIERHKWLGVIAGALAMLLYYQVQYRFMPSLQKIVSILLASGVIGAGHYGAALSHGDDFIVGPLRKTASVKPVSIDEPEVFAHVIEPLLKEKCMACHDEKKAKGKLVMSTREGIMKGGKTGRLFVAGVPEKSLMMERIHLPQAEKKHMPPANKPQLTDEEAMLLEHWIRSGNMFGQRVSELPAGDTLRLLAQQRIESGGQENYDFPFADDDIIDRLNTEYRVVFPLAANSPALIVNVYNQRAYSSRVLQDLVPVQKQIVALDLNKMPVTDDDLNVIGGFVNLRRLNLNGTPITGEGLKKLASLKNLRTISVSSTALTEDDLHALAQLPKLRTIYAWNTSVTTGSMKNVVVETGYSPDRSEVLRLTPPRIDNEKRLYSGDFSIRISHPVPGVMFRYTTDGSLPDSVNGFEYRDEIRAAGSLTTLKVRAYKKGWWGSEVTTATFFRNTFRPDTVILKTHPGLKYFPSYNSKALTDLENGDLNYGSYSGWYGYREGPMEIEANFSDKIPLSEILISTRNDIGAYVLPPQRVQVWGSVDQKQWVLLAEVQPAQPASYTTALMPGVLCVFRETECRFVRIKADPVLRLPLWHGSKGQRAWIMVDEILFN
jgi:uncharacterized membrane protein